MSQVSENIKKAAGDFMRLSQEKPRKFVDRLTHTEQVVEEVINNHGIEKGSFENLFLEVRRQRLKRFDHECWQEEAGAVDRIVGRLWLEINTSFLVRRGRLMDIAKVVD